MPRSLGMLFMTSTCAACRFSIHSLQALHAMRCSLMATPHLNCTRNDR